MNKIIHQILNIGTQHSSTAIEKQRVMLVNGILLIIILVLMLIWFTSPLRFTVYISSFVLSLVGVVIWGLYLNHLGQFDFLKYIILWGLPTAGTVINLFFPFNEFVFYAYFIILLMGLILFTSFRVQIFHIILIAIYAIITRSFAKLESTSIYIGKVDILPKVVHAFVLIAVIYLVSRYSSISSKEEQQLQKDFKQLETYSLQLKANQQQLQAQNEELKAINQELEKFAFVASHDLKTPVRNIKSFLGLAKRQIKDYDDKDVHEYLRFAQSSTEQMQALVEDILAFSRITPRKEEYQEVQLAHVVQMAQDNIQNFTQSKNAKIEIATLPTIYAHPEQMTRLFESLIENGILYNKSENPKVSISSKQLPNSSYQVLVSDNGIGVGKEHFEKIFKIFKRLHTQVEYQGSGVGLAKCKKIVELHGGIISLQSQVGKGTTFYIKLPSRTERTGD